MLYRIYLTLASGDLLRPLDILKQPYPTIYGCEMVKYQHHPGCVKSHCG